MSIQQFCLRWNNHQPNFISVFTTMLNTESLVDVTLAAEGRHLQAHKVVLSACSEYFQALFTANPSQHPIVILKDVKYADLRIMVDFMYYGEVNVSEEQLPQILETAKMLKIKGLTEMPESTSLTKSQSSTSTDLTTGESSWESQRHSISPSNLSPSSVKRRRFRKISTGSGPVEQRSVGDRGTDGSSASLAPVKSDTIILSSLPQRRKEIYEEFGKEPDENGAIDATLQQITENQSNNMSIEGPIDANQSALPQGGQWTMMEHAPYPRYSNTCVGGNTTGLQPDSTMTFAMNHHMDMNYNQSVNMAGPLPGLIEPQPTQGALPLNSGPKRRRTSNPQGEESFQKALEAVRIGGIGFCKAARIFGVNNRTLWLEYKRRGYPNNRPSIKSRIKREHTSPSPEDKEELQPQEHDQMPVLSHPHSVTVDSFMDSRQVDFSVQSAGHNSPLNLHGINFNTMQ